MAHARSALRAANATLVLTALHHLYGGVLYRTPWRLHGGAVALALAAVAWATHAAYARTRSLRHARAFALFVVAFPVVVTGGFEGVYNHLLKNVLFFGGVDPTALLRWYPPPTYELPNDALFELSGLAQIVPAAMAGIAIARFVRREPPRRIARGEVLPARTLRDVLGREVPLPDATNIVHLQLRRFAGCPVCNLHLRSFVVRHDEIAAAGIREVVVFHSPEQELQAYAGELPFAVVADPDRALYRELGAQSSVRSVLDPRVWMTIVVAVVRSAVAIVRGRERPPALIPHGGRFGLPAELLVDTDGRVLACKYGAHAGDQWSVDELFATYEHARGLPRIIRVRDRASLRG